MKSRRENVLKLSPQCSLRHRVQTGSGAHPASYTVGTGALTLGVKRPGRKAYYLSSLVPKLMRRATSSLLQYVFIVWCLVKYRGNFTYTFTPAGMDKSLT